MGTFAAKLNVTKYARRLVPHRDAHATQPGGKSSHDRPREIGGRRANLMQSAAVTSDRLSPSESSMTATLESAKNSGVADQEKGLSTDNSSENCSIASEAGVGDECLIGRPSTAQKIAVAVCGFLSIFQTLGEQKGTSRCPRLS